MFSHSMTLQRKPLAWTAREITVGRSELVVADSSDAESVAASVEPSTHWNGFASDGLDRVTLVTLWSLLESGCAYDHFDTRLDSIHSIRDSEFGPWVDVLTPEMLAAFSRIAAMGEDEFRPLLEKWNRTDVLEGWDESELSTLLREIGDLAETAQLEQKALLLWISR